MLLLVDGSFVFVHNNQMFITHPLGGRSVAETQMLVFIVLDPVNDWLIVVNAMLIVVRVWCGFVGSCWVLCVNRR